MKTSTTTDGQPTVTWVLETKFKELTDEEILSCWHECGQMLTIQQMRINFAKAILRKAQEK